MRNDLVFQLWFSFFCTVIGAIIAPVVFGASWWLGALIGLAISFGTVIIAVCD